MLQSIISSLHVTDIGIFIIRVGIGLICITNGYGKLIGGTQTWIWLGSNMKFLGITFLPILWGLLAVISEFLGGFCLLFGFATRIAAFFLCFTMFIALLYHFDAGDSWKIYSYPLSLFLVFLGLCFTGSGLFSIDACWK